MKSKSSTVRGLWPVYAAYLVSQVGNWAFRASVLYEIYNQQGGDSIFLGATVVLIYGFILLGSRFLAPYVDRFSSKRVLISLDGLRLLILLPLLFLNDLHQIGTVILTLSIVAILSLSSPMFTAAQLAYIRRTVEKDNVANAIAVISNIDWLTYLLGTVSGAFLLLKVDFRGIVFIDITTFALSLALVAGFLRYDGARVAAAASEGLTTKAGDISRSIYYFLGAIFLLNLGAGVTNLYPNIVAHDVYHTGQIGLSTLYLGNGIGGFLGALCVGRFRKWLKNMQLLVISVICIAASLVGMSIFTSMIVSVVASSLMLFFGQIFGIIANTYLLTTFPMDKAGKASGLFTGATFAGVAANSVVFSVIQTKYTLQSFLVFLIFCVIAALSSILLFLLYKKSDVQVQKWPELIPLVLRKQIRSNSKE